MDLSELKGIVSLMQKSDLTELEIELKDLKLRLSRPGSSPPSAPSSREVIIQSQPAPPPPTANPPTASAQSSEEPKDTTDSFPSPMVGTFYRRPSPDDPEFVKVGDNVKKGDVLCIIEAMKVMNEIQSDFSGVIVETLIEDGMSVEYGQPLFKIRPL